MYNALLESVADEDKEYMAHLAHDLDDNAAEEDETFAALVGEDGDDEVVESVDQDGEDEAHALAALSLDKLLKW